ncbi:unnamed protein product [Somion occarium]|uniref:Uncharacterized protein n=1 Tax=Somion occarium TaxID=3059160 RepID=A0ABP1D2B8_9APHY
MSMFNERLVRSGMAGTFFPDIERQGICPTQAVYIAAGVALAAHLLTWILPDTLHVFTTMQSSVAILALASLAVLVVTHHRREANLLTQTQEEMILIAAFGFAWFAILVGIRAFRRLGADPGPAAHTNAAHASGSDVGAKGGSGWRKSYPCDSDSLYCIEEEWTWY